MSEELKPCPFCGGKSMTHTEGWEFSGVWWTVCCPKCDFSGPEFLKKDEAIAAWNNRAVEQ